MKIPKRLFLKIVSVVTVIVFLWTNFIWAGDWQDVIHGVNVSKNCLAIETRLPSILEEAQIYCEGEEVYYRLEELGIDTLEEVIAYNKDVLETLKKDGRIKEPEKLRWLTYPGEEGLGKSATYIINGDGVLLRITRRDEPIEDKLHRLLRLMAKGEIKEFGNLSIEAFPIAGFVIGIVNSFIEKIRKNWHIRPKPVAPKRGSEEGRAIRLIRGHLSKSEHIEYNRFVEDLIRKGRARTLFGHRMAQYPGEISIEQDPTSSAFYNALRELKKKLPSWFDVVIIDGLEKFMVPDVILHPGIKRGQAYISSRYLELLGIVYDELSKEEKEELIEIILEAFSHEVKHMEQEGGVEEVASPFRAKELFRILYTRNKTGVKGDVKNFLFRLKNNERRFVSYLYSYTYLDLEGHLKIVDKLLEGEHSRIDIILAQYHLGYVLSHSEPKSSFFNNALKVLRTKNVIDIGPEVNRPYALYKFVRELVRRNGLIENYRPLPQMNWKVLSLDQVDPWDKGGEDRAGDSVRLPKEGETTALPITLEQAKVRIEKLTLSANPEEGQILKNGIISMLRENDIGQVIISNESLKIIGDSLVSKVSMEINAAGKGGRTRRKKFIRGRPVFIDIARGCIPVPMEEGARTIIEIFLAQTTGVNDIYKPKRKTSENVPIVVYTSHLTEKEISAELKRLGYKPKRLEPKRVDNIINIVTHWEYTEDPNVSPIEIIRIRKSNLFDLHTGDFYRNVDPSMPWEEWAWPDAHDSAFIDFITSGMAYELVSKGYRYRFISNVDNRAAVLDPILLAIMELTQRPLINEISRKPPGEKGGTALKFKEDKVPGLLDFGHRKGLLEGWEINKNLLDSLTQEQMDKYFPFFNTASFIQNILQYTREAFLRPDASDEEVIGFLKKFHDAGYDIEQMSELKYLLLERCYRGLTQCWEEDKDPSGQTRALQPSNITGLHTWLVDTLFVEVPEGPTAGPFTRFEPFKVNIWNLIDQVEFIQYLIRVNGEDTLLADAKLEEEDTDNIDKIAELNDLKGEFGKDVGLKLGEALMRAESAVKKMRDSLRRTESKGIQGYISLPRGLEKEEDVYEAIGRFKRWKQQAIAEGRSLTEVDIENKIQELAAEYGLKGLPYTYFYHECDEEILAETPLDMAIGELLEKAEVTSDIVDEIIERYSLSESDRVRFLNAVDPILISINRMNRNLQEGNTWDMIVVTTDSEKIKEYMEEHFRELKGAVFPKNINILIRQRPEELGDLGGTIRLINEIWAENGWRPTDIDDGFMKEYNSLIRVIDSVLIGSQNAGVNDPYEILKGIKDKVSLEGLNDVLRYIIEYQVLKRDSKGRLYLSYNQKQIYLLNLQSLFQKGNMPFSKLSELECYLLKHILLSLMLKILIIHTPGSNIQNYPLTPIYGTKTLIPTPATRSGKILTYIDQVICQFHMVIDDTPSGTITVGACDQFWAVGRPVKGGTEIIQVYGSRIDFVQELIAWGIVVIDNGKYKLASRFNDDYYMAGKEMGMLIEGGGLQLITELLRLGYIKTDENGKFLGRIGPLDPTSFIMEFLEKGYTNIHWWNHRLNLSVANALIEEYPDIAGDEDICLNSTYDLLDPFSMGEEEYIESQLNRAADQYIKELWAKGDITIITTSDEIEAKKKDYISSKEKDLRLMFKKRWSVAQKLKELGVTIGYLDAWGYFKDTANNPQMQKVYTQAPTEIVSRELLNMTENIIASPEVEEAVRRDKLTVSPGAIIINSRIKSGRIGSGTVIVDSDINFLRTEDGPIMVWNCKAIDESLVLTSGDFVCDIYDPNRGEFLRVYLPIIESDILARWFATLTNQPSLERLRQLVGGVEPRKSLEASQRYSSGESIKVIPGRCNVGLINPAYPLRNLPSELTNSRCEKRGIGWIESTIKRDVDQRFIEFVRGLGLDPDLDSPIRIRSVIAKFFEELEDDIDKNLLPGDLHNIKGLTSFIEALVKELEPEETYALTEKAALRILKEYPPNKLISKLGYPNLEAFLGKEDPRNMLAMAYAEEGSLYMKDVLEWIRNNIGPQDFQWQPIVIVPVESRKLKELIKREWLYSRDRLTGRILVSTIPMGRGGRCPKLYYLLLIARAIINSEESGKIWDAFAKEDRDKFSEWLVNTLSAPKVEFVTNNLCGRWVFTAGVHEKLLERLRRMASKVTLPLKDRLLRMCNGYDVCKIMPDGTFITCSGLSWAGTSFKSVRDPYKFPSASTSRVEQNMAARKFLIELLTFVSSLPVESVLSSLYSGILEQMKTGRRYEDLLDWLSIQVEYKFLGSQYTRRVDETKKEQVLLKADIDSLGQVGDFVLQEGVDLERLMQILKMEDINQIPIKVRNIIQLEMDWLRKEYGAGIFGAAKEVWFVDNLGGLDSMIKHQKGAVAILQDGRILIDIDSLRQRQVFRDTSKHELYESILELVEENPGIREVAAIYQNLKDFIMLLEEDQKILVEFLNNPLNGLDSQEYARLLSYIMENKIIDEDQLISLAISYVLNTPRYSHLRESLGGILHSDIKVAQQKLGLAISIYEDLDKAVNGWQSVIKQVKDTEEKVWQKTQERGSSRVYKAINKLKMSYSLVRYRMNTMVPRLLGSGKFVRLDIDELQNNPGLIEWIRSIDKEENCPFVYFSTSKQDVDKFLKKYGLRQGKIPESAKVEDVITLIDPANIRDDMPQDTLYLLLPYARTTIYLAVEVALAGGKVALIKDTLILSTVRSIYEALLNKSVSDEELEELFLRPQKIVKVTEALNAIKEAIREFEGSA